MVDGELTVELDYSDGFREGFLQGMLAAYHSAAEECSRDGCTRTVPCDRDGCPRSK